MSAAPGARAMGRPQRPRTAEELAAEMRLGGMHAHQLSRGSRASGTRWYLIRPGSKTPMCATSACFTMQFKTVEGATNNAN